MTYDGFRPMLAVAADMDKIEYPIIGQPKYDGIRCVVHPDLGPVSRTLKPIPNDYIREKIASFRLDHLDGEIITYDSNFKMKELNDVTSDVMSKSGTPDFIFNVFDYTENPDLPYGERMFAARRHIQNSDAIDKTSPSELRLVESKVLHDLDELCRYENNMVDTGWEGIILRKIEGRYKFGRATVNDGLLLKVKRFVDAEARIIGFTELYVNTNEAVLNELGLTKRSSNRDGRVPSGTLGNLIVEMVDAPPGVISFEVGTGFKAEDRKRIWENRHDMMGRLITFKYQRIGPLGRPLLPVFKAFRDVIDI